MALHIALGNGNHPDTRFLVGKGALLAAFRHKMRRKFSCTRFHSETIFVKPNKVVLYESFRGFLNQEDMASASKALQRL